VKLETVKFLNEKISTTATEVAYTDRHLETDNTGSAVQLRAQ
jgi:hypothetical protein